MDRCGLCGVDIPELTCEHFIVEHKRTSDEAMLLVNRFVLGENSARMVEEAIAERKRIDASTIWWENFGKELSASMRKRQDILAAEALARDDIHGMHIEVTRMNCSRCGACHIPDGIFSADCVACYITERNFKTDGR